MKQNQGLNGTLSLSQIYIEVNRDSDYIAYAWPVQFRDAYHLHYRRNLDPPYLSRSFEQIQNKSGPSFKTFLDYSDFDLAHAKTRVSQQFYPLNINGSFIGTIVWESNLKEVFNQMLIPASFKTQRYPFIQFRLPEFPNEIRIK